jgi:hypothetical protein
MSFSIYALFRLETMATDIEDCLYLISYFSPQCGVQNFRRRDQCFKCGGPKTESEMEEGSEEVSPNPTNSKIAFRSTVFCEIDLVLYFLLSRNKT